MTILCMLFKIPLPSRFDRKCFTYFALGWNLIFARCESYLTPFLVVLILLALQCLHLFSDTLVCYYLCPWYLSLLPKCWPWTYPLKASPFFQPSLRAASYPSCPWLFLLMLPHKFCLSSILRCVSVCYHPHLVVYRSCLDTHIYFYSLKKFLSSTSIWERQFTHLALDAPSPFPFACPVLTPSFMVLISFVSCLFTSSPTS
jgi:hypothetical protein